MTSTDNPRHVNTSPRRYLQRVGAVILAAVLGTSSALAFAESASAHNQIATLSCGPKATVAHVKLDSYESGATLLVVLDGVAQHGSTAPDTATTFGGNYTLDVTNLDNTTAHTLYVKVNSDDGPDTSVSDPTGDGHSTYDGLYDLSEPACGTVYDAVATLSVTTPSCASPGMLQYSGVGVDFTGTANGTAGSMTAGVNTPYVVDATLQPNHGWADPAQQTHWNDNIPGVLAPNSADCIITQTGKADHTDAVCSGAPNWTVSNNALTLTAVPGGIWSRDSVDLAIGVGFSGNETPGLHTYVLRDGDATDGNNVTPYTDSWNTPDRSKIVCAPPTVNDTCTTFTAGTSTPSNHDGFEADDQAGTYVVNGYEITATPKENIYHTASGLLSSVNGLGYTVINKVAGTATASYQLRIFSNGVGQFNSVVWEPYNNGLPVDFSGTVTSSMLLNGKWWLTHPNYANNVAPQSHPETLNTILAQIPNATMAAPKAYGVNIGSGGVPGGDSVVTSISGFCHTTTFGLDIITTPPTLVVPGPTCLADGGPLPALGTNGALDRIYNGPGSYTLTYTAPAGQAYPTGLTVSYTVVVLPKLLPSDPLCQIKVTPVNPDAADSVCKAGQPTGMTYAIPTTTGVTYLKGGVPIAAGTYTPADYEKVVITAQAANNTFALTDPAWSWTYTFSTKALCLGELAFTGAPAGGASLLAGGIAILLVGFFLIMARRKATQQG